MSYTIRSTKKLLDRIKPATGLAFDGSTTFMGNWYATALFWKPQLVLLVNEQTLLPVLITLAPASNLTGRFPQQLERVLTAHGIAQSFIDRELAQMREVEYAKTSNRSVVGIMNQFSYLTEGYRDYLETDDLLELSLKLSETPCSPLYKGALRPIEN
jgi:hypothetical protein